MMASLRAGNKDAEEEASLLKNPDEQRRYDQDKQLPSAESGSQRVVFVRLVFLKIGDIDTVKELYQADLFIQARWREPELDSKTDDELKETNFSELWNPRIAIENEITEKKSNLTQKALRNDRGEVIVYERRKMRGDFFENLELQHFPVDVQDLSITLVTPYPSSEVELIPDDVEPSSVNVGTFADQQEWKLYSHVEDVKETRKEFAGFSHSAVRFTCHAARRAGFFCYNTFFVMFLICTLSFGTFAVGDCSQAGGRIGLTFTLVLTFSAYKMAANQSLPRISYLTYLDKYYLMCLSYLAGLVGWHSVASKVFCLDKDSTFMKEGYENWIILGCTVFYFIAQVVFFVLLYIFSWKRRHRMAKKDAEFQVEMAAKADLLKMQRDDFIY